LGGFDDVVGEAVFRGFGGEAAEGGEAVLRICGIRVEGELDMPLVWGVSG
jgi:hypothetical protein